MHHGRIRRRLLTTLVTGFAALALVACGGDDEGNSGDATIDLGETTATLPTTLPEGVPTTADEIKDAAKQAQECIAESGGDPQKIQDCLKD